MPSSLRYLIAVASIAAAAACGGSGPNAALTRTFNYGAPQAPSSSEQAAATTAQTNLSQTAAFSAAPDATSGAAIIVFADTLAGVALGSTGIGSQSPSGSDLARSVRTLDVSACTTVTANKVTFNNCTQSASGFNVTFNGTITASAGSVAWNVSGSFAGTSNNVSFNIAMHQAGSMTVAAGKITGSATSDLSGSVSGQGQSVSFGVATAAVVDLTYQTTPTTCVTSGTVEVKRVWTQKPNGASGPQFADAGVRLTWSACNSVQVQHSM